MDDSLQVLCAITLISTSVLFIVLQTRLIWIIAKYKEFNRHLSYTIIAVCTVPDLPQNLAHFASGIHNFIPHFNGLRIATTILGSTATGGFNAMVIGQFALALNRLDVFKPKDWNSRYYVISWIGTSLTKLTMYITPTYMIAYAVFCNFFGHFTFDRETMSWFYDDKYPSGVFCRSLEFWLTMSVSVLTLATYFIVLYCMIIMKNIATVNKAPRISGTELRLLASALIQFLVILVSNISWYIPHIPPFIVNFIWAWTGGIGTIMHLVLNQKLRLQFCKGVPFLFQPCSLKTYTTSAWAHRDHFSNFQVQPVPSTTSTMNRMLQPSSIIAEIRYAQGGQENLELAKPYYDKAIQLNPEDTRSLFGVVLVMPPKTVISPYFC